MLISKCCQNYLCHYCADEIVEREKTVDAYVAQCPYNCEGKFELADVNPNTQAKRYSDSQYMSFYSNNLGKNTIGGQSGFNFNKGKENMSPMMGSGHMVNKKLFQNSANAFGKYTPMGYLEGINEETKNDHVKAQMMHRSDAMQHIGKPNMRNVRQSVIREAN